jgi:hypothetical protein
MAAISGSSSGRLGSLSNSACYVLSWFSASMGTIALVVGRCRLAKIKEWLKVRG